MTEDSCKFASTEDLDDLLDNERMQTNNIPEFDSSQLQNLLKDSTDSPSLNILNVEQDGIVNEPENDSSQERPVVRRIRRRPKIYSQPSQCENLHLNDMRFHDEGVCGKCGAIASDRLDLHHSSHHPGRHFRRSHFNTGFFDDVQTEVHRAYTGLRTVGSHVGLHVNQFAQKFWRVCHHRSLPDWLRDNEYLLHGHRPEMNNFSDCFKSIFRLHTETVNIWTHLIGFVMFAAIAGFFLSRPSDEIHLQEKLVFLAFFSGAMVCFSASWIFHTVCCHSLPIGSLFNKLDYLGISCMILGSYVPWLYYSFYCHIVEKIAYMSLISALTIASSIVSFFNRFRAPKYRSLRAGLFIGTGLSGLIPVCHMLYLVGFETLVYKYGLGWLVLMATLYISGAVIYANRVPERLFPGKFDIWGQSHQIFHIFVLTAAFVHYHGITMLTDYRLTMGDCVPSQLQNTTGQLSPEIQERIRRNFVEL